MKLSNFADLIENKRVQFIEKSLTWAAPGQNSEKDTP